MAAVKNRPGRTQKKLIVDVTGVQKTPKITKRTHFPATESALCYSNEKLPFLACESVDTSHRF
jgi:hypothetical protein